MKKNFIYLLLLCSLIAQAQVTPSYPTIKLTKTVEGVKQDSLLVIGTDKIVKHIPYSKISSVQEYATASALPITGVASKLYFIKDINKIYTWNGTFYSEVLGAKGEKGDQGVAGIVGAKGDQGIQGVQGLKGDTGAKGDTGSFNGDITADQVTETATRKFQTANQAAYNDATSSIQSQLNSKEPSFTKNTAFNKDFGTTAGTVVEGGTLGSNAYTSTAYLPLSGGLLNGVVFLTNNTYFQGSATYGFRFNNNAGTENNVIFLDNGNVTVRGNVTASGGFFNSDRRLKNIFKRDGDVAYYTWKDRRDNKTHIGYIAQEVQENHPNQVQADEKGILSVNYVEILVEKIRVLEKRIDQLEKK